jgi:phosphohistidine phosphatase SixA
MISLQRHAATVAILAAFAGASACAAASAGEAPVIPDGRDETTVYLVRHGEKFSDTDPDPNLSARGRARAESLAVQLRDSGVNMIITSHLKRTIQTAAPLADLRHIRPRVIPIEPSVDFHVKRIADEILKHPGATILVVGHNNTVSKILEKISGEQIGDLCTDEYSNLIIVSLSKGKPAKTLLETYGAPDPPAAPGGCPHIRDR